MSGFFESEVVRNAIKEMEELQQEIIEPTFSTPLMTPEQKREHVDLMKTFLEKQKNLYFRLTLSDDPEWILDERTNERKFAVNFWVLVVTISMNCLPRWKKL